MSEVTIPNWTRFGCHAVNIEVYEVKDDEIDESNYSVSLGFYLDDGKEINDNDEIKYISIFTGIIENSVEDAVEHVISHLNGCMFDFTEEYSVFKLDGSVNSYPIEGLDESDEFQTYIPQVRVLH